MKKIMDWSNKTDLIFAIVCCTFLLAFLILGILLRRGGRSIETAAIIKKIDATRVRLENVDLRIERDHRHQANWMRRLLARFGFLEAEDIVRDIKQKLNDDVRIPRRDDDGD